MELGVTQSTVVFPISFALALVVAVDGVGLVFEQEVLVVEPVVVAVVVAGVVGQLVLVIGFGIAKPVFAVGADSNPDWS